MLASIIIRTYNEQRYLSELLEAIGTQETKGYTFEVVIVDSGSTDKTLEIAERHGCRTIHIKKEEFSFGRSLNMGCDAAQGEYLVFISGHCVPASKDWLLQLINPLVAGLVSYTYGRQLGGEASKFSERQLFNKYFPETSSVPQEGFFCNNANSALTRAVWQKFPFDEELTGLEDMHLAKRLVEHQHKIGYVAEAPVYHYHNESWPQVKRRYEREAIALQSIMPEIQVNFGDFLRYFTSALLLDVGAAVQQKRFLQTLPETFMFRLMQFWGSYRGNHEHRKLSRRKKELYFYPR